MVNLVDIISGITLIIIMISISLASIGCVVWLGLLLYRWIRDELL